MCVCVYTSVGYSVGKSPFLSHELFANIVTIQFPIRSIETARPINLFLHKTFMNTRKDLAFIFGQFI